MMCLYLYIKYQIVPYLKKTLSLKKGNQQMSMTQIN